MTRGADDVRKKRYGMPLADLEASAHVPQADQVVEQPAAPRSESPVQPEDLDRMKLLGVVGDGRLNVRG